MIDVDDYRHEFDNDSQNSERTRAVRQIIIEVLTQGKEHEFLRKFYDDMRELAEKLDKYFSQYPNKDIRFDYASRMKFCVDKLGVLKANLGEIERGKRPNIAETARAGGYLFGELKGLEFTLEKLSHPE